MLNRAVASNAPHEKIANTLSGPVCLVQLPAGHYTVLATTDKGRSLSRSVDVGKGSKSLDFSF